MCQRDDDCYISVVACPRPICRTGSWTMYKQHKPSKNLGISIAPICLASADSAAQTKRRLADARMRVNQSAPKPINEATLLQHAIRGDDRIGDVTQFFILVLAAPLHPAECFFLRQAQPTH
jgi:hypothetical protein